MGAYYKVKDGVLYKFDVDEDWWPEGEWIPVCLTCLAGPLSRGEVYCGDYLDTPGTTCLRYSNVRN